MAEIRSILRGVLCRLKPGWPYIFFCAAVVFVYCRLLFFGYTYLDDNIFILDGNWFLRNPANIGKVFLTEVFHFQHAAAAYYRPLLTLSFMLDAQLGGISPVIYHLTNMLLHGAAVCLLFAFLKTFGVRAPAAFALSLIFAVHPVLAQAIAWIPGRNDSLLAVFVLSAAMMFLRYWENGKFRYLLLHSLFFACGLFTKESMAFFPFLCGLWALLTVIFTGPASPRSFLQRLLGKMPCLAGLFAAWMLPGVLWFSLRTIALANPVHYPLEDAVKSLLNNSPALLMYCGKILFPFNLSVLPILRDSTLAYGIAAIVLLSAAVIVYAVRFRKGNSKAPLPQEQIPFEALLLFGFIWFLLFLVPSFIQPNAHYPADFLEHRTYIPLIGLLLAAGRTPFINSINFSKVSSWIFAGCIVFLFVHITTRHIGVFNDRISFWKNAVAHSPHHPLAHKNLGVMYYLDGKMDLAEKEYAAALELYPQETMVHNNLGVIYKVRKDYLKAEEEFKKELEINPNYDNALFNWGVLCYEAGNKKEAETLWLKTLQVNPDFFEAMRKLYLYYRDIGDSVNETLYRNKITRRIDEVAAYYQADRTH
ncbi:MAG: tetratricopeptide repeat protein [Chitinispirillaceae bacterium]|jgi:tetratricopeptide (TPR) repeat protein